MSPKRQRPKPTASSSSSSSSEIQRKRHKPAAANAIRIHIIPAKLDSTVLWELHSALDNNRVVEDDLSISYALIGSNNEQDADVLVTAVRMKKRLERHIDWELARAKSVVTPKWLQVCLNTGRLLPFEGYFAVPELQEPVKHKPDHQWFLQQPFESETSGVEPLIPTEEVRSVQDIDYRQPSSCLRYSPLECWNQKLVSELGILCRSRELEGQDINALAYERAIGTIKSYPHSITADCLASDIVKLPHVGEKVLTKIIEFVEDGYIAESRSLAESQRFQSLSIFSSIYGIGATTARKLYAQGVRTLNDLERYYDVFSSAPSADEANHTGHIGDIPLLSIRAGIRLLSELEEKIPRGEAEEMYQAVMDELGHVKSGCVGTITGGYRRGKTQSNDVDVVISHEELRSGHMKDLCDKLLLRLHKRGLVTHVMHLSSFHQPDALKTSHWDSLQKALTVFKLPDDGTRKRIHRRVDLIFATPEVYWTAITGWTGSKLFERDLRLWAKTHGFKFDSSGITRRRDSKMFFPRSEEEVFDLLGLPWIDPTMRNADS